MQFAMQINCFNSVPVLRIEHSYIKITYYILFILLAIDIVLSITVQGKGDMTTYWLMAREATL